MTKILGLVGLRPGEGWAKSITCPPYDVIKPGTALERLLKNSPDSLFHVTLGADPTGALAAMQAKGALVEDWEPAYYIYEQNYDYQNKQRVGVIAALEVTPYERREVIRHEKTFDEKVRGRIELMEATGYVTEPIWTLTKAPLGPLLRGICAGREPVYEFTSDFGSESELDGIHNRVFRVPASSAAGKNIEGMLADGLVYIADGHHRYHSALKMGLNACVAYICQDMDARILAYNRVIKGKVDFQAVIGKLPLEKTASFTTPERHHFSIYTRDGCWQYKVSDVDEGDAIRRLDCQILEETLYPFLRLSHDMIMDNRYFDYYSEHELDKMAAVVDKGDYDLAVALHPVSMQELMTVADAGLADQEIVMPEKSTFFSPKILSGLMLMPAMRR